MRKKQVFDHKIRVVLFSILGISLLLLGLVAARLPSDSISVVPSKFGYSALSHVNNNKISCIEKNLCYVLPLGSATLLIQPKNGFPLISIEIESSSSEVEHSSASAAEKDLTKIVQDGATGLSILIKDGGPELIHMAEHGEP